MTELTPAVQDAAHNLGWRLAAMGFSDPFNVPTEQCDALEAAIRAGHAAFTHEAEAERVEAVRAWHDSERTMMTVGDDPRRTADRSERHTG